MRSLVLLALVTLAALPLSARGHGRDHHPRIEVRESCRPAYGWEARHLAHPRHDNRRWDDRWDGRYRGHRWDRHGSYGHHDCDGPRVLLRPLPPPFLGRVVVRFH